MNKIIKKYRKQTVNIKTVVASVIFFLLGLLLLYFSTKYQDESVFMLLLNNLGAILFSISLVAIIWDLIVKRAFLKEIMSQVNLSSNISDAGIENVAESFHDIDWKDFYLNANEINLLIFHAMHTISTNTKLIIEAAKSSTQINVYLPNPENIELIKRLSAMDNYSNGNSIKYKIDEAINFFKQNEIRANIFLTNEIHPLYMYYSDKTSIIGLNKEITFNEPVFIVSEKDGLMYKYSKKLLEKIKNEIKTGSNNVYKKLPEQ
jgi:hypothetical protein